MAAMELASVRAAAELLWDLWSNLERRPEMPAELCPRDLDDAWAIQRACDSLAGPRIGWKIAASTPEGQAVIGVDAPLIGALYERQLVSDGGTLPVPSIEVAEAEFVFRMAGDLDPADAPFSRAVVLAQVGGVYPGLEIPDCRLSNYPDIGGPQMVADFMCGDHFAVGASKLDLELSSLPQVEVIAYRNDLPVGRGRGVDVLGDPCDALVWTANELARRGEALRSGDFVMTGGCAVVFGLSAGDLVRANFAGMSDITILFTDTSERAPR